MSLLVPLMAAAFADPPDHTLALLPIGDGEGGQVERMAVSDDGVVVVGRTRNDQSAWLLDVDRWTLTPFSGPSSPDTCAVTGAAVFQVEDGTYEIWLSCLEGKLVGRTWDGESLGTVVDSEGVAFVLDGIDESLNGVWWHPGSQLLYAVTVPDDEFALTRIHVADPFAGTVDAAIFPTFPNDFAYPDFNEAVVLDDLLVVSHQGRDMSTLLLGADVSPAPGNFTTLFNCVDITPSPFVWTYCVDPIGQIAQFTPTAGQFTVLPLGVLAEPQAVVVSDDPEDGWLAVTGLQVQVWVMEPDGTIPDPTPYFESAEDTDSQIYDMITKDSYVYGGGVSGSLHVVSSRPWVKQSVLAAAPTSGGTGDVVTLTFAADEDVDWEVFRGGDRFGVGGVSLGTGSAADDEVVSIEVTLGDDWIEGDNAVYVIVTNDAGLTGHGRVDILVDNPPKPPVLTNANVAFADEALVLTFDGIADEDLDRYEVYVSVSEFDPEAWATGGPAFDGETELVTPISIEAEPGATVTHRIQPLENYVTYYIGVRAWDDGGKEGPMSLVVSGTPEPTFTAAELADEQGGGPCDTGAGAGAALTPFVALVAFARRRARRAAVVAAGLAVWAVSPTAHAQQKPFWERADDTRARGDFEIRYGTIALTDEFIEAVYDEKPTNLLQLEFGPQIFRVVEIDAGFGFFQELAHTESAGGADSGDLTMLTWWPLQLDATLRLHLLDEQPIVPFVRYGWDYVLYSEKSDDGAGGKNVIRGAKFGSHWAVGGNLLLDTIEPRRASLLEAQTGINDSWITVEYRRQVVDDRDAPWEQGEGDQGLVFSGNAFLIGLKIDY